MFYKNIFIHIIYFIITICHFDSYSNETESGRKYIYSESKLISLAKQALNLADFNFYIGFAQRRYEKQEAMFSPYIPKLKVIKRVIKITKQYCAILEFIEQKLPDLYLLLTFKQISLYKAQECLQEGIKNFKEILDFVSNNTDPEINSKINNFIIMNYHNLLLMDSNNTVKNYIIQKYKASLEYKIPLNKDGIPMIEVINQVIRYADRPGEKIIEINKKRNLVTKKKLISRRRAARSKSPRNTIINYKKDYSKSENFGKTGIPIDYEEENTHDSCNNKSEPQEKQQESTLMQDEQQESTQHSQKKKKHNSHHSNTKSAQEEQQELTFMQDEQQEPIYHGKKKKKHNSHHTKHKLAQEEQNGKPDLIQDEQQEPIHHGKRKKKHNTHHSESKLMQGKQVERAVQIDYEENTHDSCDDAPLAQIDQENNSNNYACNNEQPLIEQIDKEDNSSNYDNNKENEAYITGEMQIEHKEYSDNIQEVEGAAKMDNQSYDSCGRVPSLEQEEQISNQQTVQDILNQPHVQQEQCNLDEIANQQTIQEILNQSQVQQEQNVQDILSQSQIQQEQNVTNETSNQQTVYDLNQSQVQQEDSDDKTLIVLFKKKRCIIMPKSYYKQYQNKEYSYSSDNNE